MGANRSHIQDAVLRQTAHAVEQMAPGGTERANPGVVTHADLDRAAERVAGLLARPGQPEAKQTALSHLAERIQTLRDILDADGAASLIYVGMAEFALRPRLRSTAIEIDFAFGNRDGTVDPTDLAKARHHYGQVRGPVGWNRLLATDEVERHLFPDQTLRSTDGLRLAPSDWMGDPPQPLDRLKKAAAHLDDDALARTYADIAARVATVAREEAEQRGLFIDALALLGREIAGRASVRPTITDIARIGCSDPEIKTWLKTPIEMSRRLRPAELLDPFLGDTAGPRDTA